MATLPNAQALTEDLSFFKGIIVGCGEASALVMAHILKGTPLSPGELTNLIQSAANANQLSGAGFGQTAANVQWDLSQFGIGSSVVGSSQLSSVQQISDTISKALNTGKPIEIGVNNGSALTGEPGSLRGHYVTIVGNSANGWIVADPNSAASRSGGFVTDTTQQLLNASPFAAIIPTQSTGTGVGNQNNGGGTNPLDIAGAISNVGTAISNLPNQMAGSIAQSLVSGFGNLIMAPFKSIGISSIQDLGWRSLFIFLAISLFVIGVIALIFDFLDKSNIEVAGSRV